MTEIEAVTIDEFRIEEIPLSSSWIIIGPPMSGKSSFIENILYYNRNKFPVAKLYIGNEDGYNKFCKIFPKLYVSNYYEEDEQKRWIVRQRELTRSDHPMRYCINILDDVTDDPKVARSKVTSAAYKIGTQHWGEMFLIASHGAFEASPVIRSSVMYVALFRNPNEDERKKLYRAYGGVCGNYKKFCDLMDQICEDHTCMIIKKHSSSNKIEDCVFWYKTKIIENKWKFGCREYWEWNKSRYNSGYIEQIEI